MSVPAYTNYAKPYNKGSSMSAAKQNYQYTLVFRQQAALELGIANVNQALILELLSIANEWATPEYVDGDKYYWTARQKVCAELPLLDLKPDTVARYLKSLVQLGLIEHIKSGKKDLTRLTDKALSYVGKKSDIADHSTMSEKNPNNSVSYVGKKSEESTEKNPTYQYNYLNQDKDIPPIVPPKGDVSDSSLASQNSKPVELDVEPVKPTKRTRAKRGEITEATELAMKELINGCDCKQVPKGFLLSYLKYRHAVIKKPVKSTQGLQAQINVLAALPSKEAMEATIKHTMDNEWIRIVVPAGQAAKADALVMPHFDLSDGGTALQKWAVKQGFRAAKGKETAWDYLAAIKVLVAEKNRGAA